MRAGFDRYPPYPPTVAWPPPQPPAPAPVRRSRWVLIPIALLAAVIAVQAYFLVQIDGRLAAVQRHRVADAAADGQRIDALSARIKALEQHAATSLDTAAVASAVLPSVFRVDAGNFSGTAFAVG